jgi:hypothetical protein
MPNLLAKQAQAKVDPDSDKFTGKFIANVPQREPDISLMQFFELCELARILGGDQPARPANSHHRIFLL